MSTAGVAGTAVVVGGGIGGLAAAIALRRGGWEVTVLERAPELGEVGAGLTVLANGVRALTALGLAEVTREAGHLDAPAVARTWSGRRIWQVSAAAMSDRLGADAVGIHRARLHRILLDVLPAAALRTDAEVIDVVAGDVSTYAAVTYRHGGRQARVEAELVVGADGLNSVTRTRLWPETPPQAYAGSTAWRGVTAHPEDVAPVTGVSWGPGAEFGVIPLGQGQVYWYGAILAGAGKRTADELAEVRNHFGSWHDPIPALLAATDPAAVLRNDIYRLAEPLPGYTRGRVALLGDAAHAMTPHLGQGANQALEDAAVLGAVLTRPVRLPVGLATYDTQRRPRTQRIARASRLAGQFGQQLRHPVAVATRNQLMRILPPRVALRAMTRFGAWQPPRP